MNETDVSKKVEYATSKPREAYQFFSIYLFIYFFTNESYKIQLVCFYERDYPHMP